MSPFTRASLLNGLQDRLQQMQRAERLHASGEGRHAQVGPVCGLLALCRHCPVGEGVQLEKRRHRRVREATGSSPRQNLRGEKAASELRKGGEMEPLPAGLLCSRLGAECWHLCCPS